MEESASFLFHRNATDGTPLTACASAMMFGTILFATVCLGTRLWLTGEKKLLHVAAFNPRASPLNLKSLQSVFSLLFHFSVFGLILFFAFICEYHPIFPHSTKAYDRDEFFFIVAMMFIASALTVHKNEKTTATVSKKSSTAIEANPPMERPPHFVEAAETSAANDLLNRDQTEEWKGWMQFIFLLYHYYHAEEVYNSIRIMITCYVWMTGFGNFSFFYLKADFSFVRVIQMLWRLNFLVIFLCLTQGTTYLLYYICPLHTFFFFMVYLSMRIRKDLNYSKYGIRIKLSCLALLIYFVWDFDNGIGIFQKIHFFLSTEPQLGATSGALWEWYFRSSLDHWSTFFGMLFALNFPIMSLFLRKLEAQTQWKCFAAKTLVGIPLLASFLIWVAIPFRLPKPQYNQTNAYFGFIPLVTYIYFRNLTPKLRSYSLNLLHEIGKTTLETYLMQHHIWLTSNAKTLLTVIPGHPKINLLVVTFIYFVTSRKLYKLTLYLRGMLLPDDKNACIKSILSLVSVVGLFCAFASMLQGENMLDLPSIGLVSVVCGSLIYAIVVGVVGKPPIDSKTGNQPSSNSTNDGITNRRNQLSPLMAGAMSVLFIGLIWKGMSTHGFGKVAPLRSECREYANFGKWVPVNDCNEATMGSLQRQHGIVNLATCHASNAQYLWGWKNTETSNHCRFTQRTAKELKKTLKNRKVWFFGDITTRNLFHAVCRSLGETNAGEMDASLPMIETTPKDEKKNIGSIQLYYKYLGDASTQLKELQLLRENFVSSPNDRADIIILGGGISDCTINLYQREKYLADLAIEIKNFEEFNIPIAWITPTTVNNVALSATADQKIHEENVELLRELYERQGILDATAFVIDGPAFTEDLSSAAFDGISYPPLVYDAGAQIFANSLDWALPSKPLDMSDYNPPSPGSMSHPYLGLMMFFFAGSALFFFDGFMGFSYMASLVVKGVKPSQLYDEAFGKLHKGMKLPDTASNSPVKSIHLTQVSQSNDNTSSKPADHNPNEEIESLLGKTKDYL